MDWIEKTLAKADNLLKHKESIFIAIDGRCASGKTTFAAQLQKQCGGSVIHMDDFFLRPEQRTWERLQRPGGNVDYERFLKEVIEPEQIIIVEGSYSCHPVLWKYYDLHIFLTINADLQMQRIRQRNKGCIDDFRDKWIPLEEKYFAACGTQSKCELIFSAS